jgi:hypothetical protein
MVLAAPFLKPSAMSEINLIHCVVHASLWVTTGLARDLLIVRAAFLSSLSAFINPSICCACSCLLSCWCLYRTEASSSSPHQLLEYLLSEVATTRDMKSKLLLLQESLPAVQGVSHGLLPAWYPASFTTRIVLPTVDPCLQPHTADLALTVPQSCLYGNSR